MTECIRKQRRTFLFRCTFTTDGCLACLDFFRRVWLIGVEFLDVGE